MRATDAAQNATTTCPALLAVYDTSAGFLTGGGWITSPVGALTSTPSLTGKATLEFDSKYEKGANVPTGSTQFQLDVGSFLFKSTSYDWLVVAGARAEYKGSGTVNGTAGYSFILTAIDGKLPGGGSDKLRIKIWNTGTGGVVYDNQMGAADAADPTMVIGGGDIVIH